MDIVNDFLVVPQDGFEPPTYWLLISCSTKWATGANIDWPLWEELNLHHDLRSVVFYPLNYREIYLVVITGIEPVPFFVMSKAHRPSMLDHLNWCHCYFHHRSPATELLPCPHIFIFRRAVTRLSDFSSLPYSGLWGRSYAPDSCGAVYPLLVTAKSKPGYSGARCLDWTDDLSLTRRLLYHWANRAILYLHCNTQCGKFGTRWRARTADSLRVRQELYQLS